MESLVMFGNAFSNKTVWLTGHTGFKGSWLAHWLLTLGARVHGFALPPPTTPALFQQLGLEARLPGHQISDLREAAAVAQSVQAAQPDFVFHLAAQPLVLAAYDQPVDTYAINVMGTIHVLEALRQLQKPCVAILVTTDKCYENREWLYGYREADPLGGHDPYSSSKAATEIAIASWRRSFFDGHPVRLASVRAGNVIGGGDWAPNRLVPDCIRALQGGQPIPVRNKVATRPWQHVLDPLSGYLWLAARLAESGASDDQLASAFNFGPGHEANRTVAELVNEVLKHWPGRWEDRSDPAAVHEAQLLQLSTDKAHARLGWAPVWTFPNAIAHTVTWYRQATSAGTGSDAAKAIQALTTGQIEHYQTDAANAGLPWAVK